MTNSFTGRDWNSGAPMRSIKMGAQLDVTTEPPSSVTMWSTTVPDPTNKIVFNSLAEPEKTYSLFFIQPIHPSPLESRWRKETELAFERVLLFSFLSHSLVWPLSVNTLCYETREFFIRVNKHVIYEGLDACAHTPHTHTHTHRMREREDLLEFLENFFKESTFQTDSNFAGRLILIVPQCWVNLKLQPQLLDLHQ